MSLLNCPLSCSSILSVSLTFSIPSPSPRCLSSIYFPTDHFLSHTMHTGIVFAFNGCPSIAKSRSFHSTSRALVKITTDLLLFTPPCTSHDNHSPASLIKAILFDKCYFNRCMKTVYGILRFGTKLITIIT